MSNELIEQLRDLANCRHDDLSIGYEAADRIEQLEAERDQLRDLLRPFAALLQEHNRKGPDDQPIFQINDAAITLGDLRRALAATEPK